MEAPELKSGTAYDASKTDGRGPGMLQELSLALSSCLTVMALIALAPVLPNMMVELESVPGAHFWVPVTFGVTGLGASVFAPFAGIIDDKYGRRGPLIGFCLLFAVAGTLPILLDDLAASELNLTISRPGSSGPPTSAHRASGSDCRRERDINLVRQGIVKRPLVSSPCLEPRRSTVRDGFPTISGEFSVIVENRPGKA